MNRLQAGLLEPLAEKAIAEAIRLDVLDASQREIDLQRQRDKVERAALERARLLNKPNFRP